MKKETLQLFFKGMAMGTADLVPGISGGTVALILGIYERLILAIVAVNTEAIVDLLCFRFRLFLKRLDLAFLLPVFLGIGTAIFTLARIVHYFYIEYRILTLSFFLGLSLAAVFILLQRSPDKKKWTFWVSFSVGFISAYLFVDLPAQTIGNHWFVLFLAGAGATSVMLLPGISGSFLLLILGKYLPVIQAIKNPFLPDNLLFLTIFIGGCLTGICLFSRILNQALQRFPKVMMAFLAGLMLGAMKKLWPWKEELSIQRIDSKAYVLQEQNVFPVAWNSEIWFPFIIFSIGFALVWLINKKASSNQ